MADHDPTITNRAAWKIGLAALPDSHVARVDAILSDDEVRAVVAACYAFCQHLGLFTEVLAVSGCRPIQAARLVVRDLEADRLQMPRSAKGRGKKRIDRRPLPVPPPLMAKLRRAAGNRPADAPLLLRPDGDTWHINLNRPFRKALAAAGLPLEIVPYALRHSSIVRSLLRGLPTRLVSDAHDTSVAMLERTYAKYIADHSDATLRGVQIDLEPTADQSGGRAPLAETRAWCKVSGPPQRCHVAAVHTCSHHGGHPWRKRHQSAQMRPSVLFRLSIGTGFSSTMRWLNLQKITAESVLRGRSRSGCATGTSVQ